MATSKNFEVKNGLSVAGTERISSAGVGTFTDLNVTGTTTTIDTANLQVKDKNIVINYGSGDTSSTASGAGITIQDAVDASNDATLLWDASSDEFDFSHTVTAPTLTIAGAATFDTSTLVVDATNNRVGVGTASPSQKLEVDGRVRATTDPTFEVYESSTKRGGIQWNAGSDYLNIFSVGGHISFDGNGNNVGIGTTSPSATLHVDASGGANFKVSRTGVDDMVYIEADGTNGVIRQPGDGALVFQMGGTSEKMRIGNTGKVSWSAGGIGNVATQSRDFTFYTEGSTNGVDIRSNDYQIAFIGGAGSSGAGMDKGYMQLCLDGSAKVAFNTDGDSYFNGGDVGIGTTSPNTTLHAATGSNGSGLTDVARFQNTGTTVNDGARIQLTAGTSTSGAGIGCLGVALNSAHLVFHSGGNTERMRIDSTGDIRFGHTGAYIATDEVYTFYNQQKGRTVSIATAGNASHYGIDMWNQVGGSCNQVLFRGGGSGATTGSITSTGNNATQFNTSSDYRLKENVDYTWDATTRLKQLKPVRFNWIDDGTNTLEDGFLAHEVSDIVPNAVTGEKDAVYTEAEAAAEIHIDAGDIKRQQLDHSKLVPLLVKTIQELEARITTLEG